MPSCSEHIWLSGAWLMMLSWRAWQVEIDNSTFSTMILALAQALEAATSKQVGSLACDACLPASRVFPSAVLNLSYLRLQDAHDRARVLMNTLERHASSTDGGASDGDGQTQPGDLVPSNEAMVAAIRALAKQMRFKQAWEVIKSMRPLGYAHCLRQLVPLQRSHPL